MKKINFSLATLFAFLLLNTSCDKVGEICFDFAQNTTVTTNAVSAPGTITVTKTVANLLSDQLTGKGVKVDNVNSVKVDKITMTIPSTAGYTFDDISAAEVKANGQSLGTLPVGATGLTATFATPSNSDVKNIFLKSANIEFVFTATFKKAVGASTLNVQIPLNTCYQLL